MIRDAKKETSTVIKRTANSFTVTNGKNLPSVHSIGTNFFSAEKCDILKKIHNNRNWLI